MLNWQSWWILFCVFLWDYALFLDDDHALILMVVGLLVGFLSTRSYTWPTQTTMKKT